MSEIETWNLTDASNNSAPPAGAPENMDPGDVNNVLRAIQGSLRRWYDDPEYLDLMRDPTDGTAFSLTRDSDTVLGIVSGAVDMRTPFFPVGRRVKVVGATTVFGRVVSSAFPNPGTTVTLDMDAAATIPTSPTTIFVNIVASLDSDFFTGAVNILEIGEFL